MSNAPSPERAAQRPRTDSRRKRFALAAALALMTLAAHAPAINGPLLSDDKSYIRDSRPVQSPDGLRRIWGRLEATPQYYPLTFTTFWLDYRLWGRHLSGYHLVNMLLHAANALLLWAVLERLNVRGGWLAAALFAVHPVNVESVAWIAERKNVLSGFFGLLSLIACLRFAGLPGFRIPRRVAGSRVHRRIAAERGFTVPNPKSEIRNPKWPVLASWRPGILASVWLYMLALALFALALLSKTAVAPLPAVLLLLIWWKRKLRWRDAAFVLPFVALAIVFGLVTRHVEARALRTEPTEGDLDWVRATLVAGRALGFYAGKLMWPANLMFNYPRWKPDTAALWQYAPPAAVATVLAVLFFVRRRIGRGPLVAALVFIALLAPVLGYFRVGYFQEIAFVADHFLYHAAPGLLALVAAAAVGLVQRNFGFRISDFRLSSSRQSPPLSNPQPRVPFHSHAVAQLRRLQTAVRERAAIIAAAAVLLILGLRTGQESWLYRDELAVWRNVLQRNDQSVRARINLGAMLNERGRPDEAISLLERADQLNPNHAGVLNNLGRAYLLKRDLDRAIECLDTSVRLAPNFWGAYYNLGEAWRFRGETARALENYSRAVERKPDFAEAYLARAGLLGQEGRYADAIADCDRVLALDRTSIAARFNRGLAWHKLGRFDQAIADYNRLLDLAPDFADGYANRADALMRSNNPAAALADYFRVIQLRPDSPVGYQSRASAYFYTQDYDRAWADVQACRKLGGQVDPRFLDALRQASRRQE